MEVDRDEFQTGAEVEANITTERGKNLGGILVMIMM
jgi:hypothetical protein